MNKGQRISNTSPQAFLRLECQYLYYKWETHTVYRFFPLKITGGLSLLTSSYTTDVERAVQLPVTDHELAPFSSRDEIR